MRTSEWMLVAYLAYLLVTAWILPLSQRRRLTVTAVIAGQGLVVGALSTARSGLPLLARDWIPALHLLVAYWLSGAFFRRPMPRVEAALAAVDRLVLRATGAVWLTRRGPRWLLEVLELAYAGVYLIVPLGFGVAYAGAPALPVDAYWTVVLGAGLVCYATLPWLQTRPPTALSLDRDVEARGLRVRVLNVGILSAGSIHVNTLPSGHAATAVATALAAGSAVPDAGMPLGLLALTITVAAAVERYHFAVDALAGALVAVAVWWVTSGRF